MPTPIYGLVIPAADSPVDVVQDVTKLATSVENTLVANAVQDTGWTLLPITDARITSYAAGAEPRWRVRNGVCTITGQLTTSTAGLIDSGVTWATLPVQARPGYQMSAVQQGSGDDRWAMIVRTNGQMTAERWGPNTSPAGVWLPFTITYLVG